MIAAVAATSAATAASAGPASIMGITTPERAPSRTIRLRARAKLALPGCRVMRHGCAAFVVRADGHVLACGSAPGTLAFGAGCSKARLPGQHPERAP